MSEDLESCMSVDLRHITPSESTFYIDKLEKLIQRKVLEARQTAINDIYSWHHAEFDKDICDKLKIESEKLTTKLKELK